MLIRLSEMAQNFQISTEITSDIPYILELRSHQIETLLLRRTDQWLLLQREFEPRMRSDETMILILDAQGIE